VVGVDENTQEELVYEIRFRSRELMLHTNFCLLTLLESRSKVETLMQLLEKTVVPIIQPSAATKTPNIIRKISEILNRAGKSADMLAVDREITNIETEIDAEVFALYGLTESEINAVMNSLALRLSQQQKILEHFRHL